MPFYKFCAIFRKTNIEGIIKMAPNHSAPAFTTATDGSATAPFEKITTAIIPVGGLGTRMLPATMSTSKNMLNIGSRTSH